MQKASICLIVENDYYGTTQWFETIGFKVEPKEIVFLEEKAEPTKNVMLIGDIEVELLVAFKPNCDKRLIEYFKPIATQTIEVTNQLTDLGINTELFALATNDYICILNPFVFLQNNWLTELMYYHHNIEKSGMVSILNDFENLTYSALLATESEALISVFIPNNYMLEPNGVFLITKNSLPNTSTTNIQRTYLKEEYKNFYIPSQTCILLSQKH